MLRAATAGLLEQRGVCETDVALIQIGLTEIVNNCIEHGYKEDASKAVDVAISIDEDLLQLDISDTAPPLSAGNSHRLLGEGVTFDDATEEWSRRGHGLQIIRQIFSEISIDHVGGQNHIRVCKQLKAGESL